MSLQMRAASAPPRRRLKDKQDGVRAEWEYPFAVAGLNITWMLSELLELHTVSRSPNLHRKVVLLATCLRDEAQCKGKAKVQHESHATELKACQANACCRPISLHRSVCCTRAKHC